MEVSFSTIFDKTQWAFKKSACVKYQGYVCKKLHEIAAAHKKIEVRFRISADTNTTLDNMRQAIHDAVTADSRIFAEQIEKTHKIAKDARLFEDGYQRLTQMWQSVVEGAKTVFADDVLQALTPNVQNIVGPLNETAQQYRWEVAKERFDRIVEYFNENPEKFSPDVYEGARQIAQAVHASTDFETNVGRLAKLYEIADITLNEDLPPHLRSFHAFQHGHPLPLAIEPYDNTQLLAIQAFYPPQGVQPNQAVQVYNPNQVQVVPASQGIVQEPQ